MIDLGTRVQMKASPVPNWDYEYGVLIERNGDDYGVAEIVRGEFTGCATWWHSEDAFDIIPTKTKMRHALMKAWETKADDAELVED